jgi:uncharacterized membrane protein YhiD involved in acid resistance
LDPTAAPASAPNLPIDPQTVGLLEILTSSLQRSEQIQLSVFAVDLLWATLLSLLLGLLYVRYGRSLSNRTQFAAHFVMVTMATMLVITLVKSSLALSLGLVGALSIVRFRTAIKEPEELSYLFVAIAIGLGFGAHQGRITVAAFAMIALMIWLRNLLIRGAREQSLNFVVSAGPEASVTLDQIVDVLRNHSEKLHLRRFDSNQGAMEAAFLVEFPRYESLNAATADLMRLHDGLTVSYVESRSYA